MMHTGTPSTKIVLTSDPFLQPQNDAMKEYTRFAVEYQMVRFLLPGRTVTQLHGYTVFRHDEMLCDLITEKKKREPGCPLFSELFIVRVSGAFLPVW